MLSRNVEFEVLTAVVMKSAIFWEIMLCSPLKVNRSFGGTYRLHLQGSRISRSRNQHECMWQCLPLLLILRPWTWRRRVPPKRRLTFNGLHSVISQKIVPVKAKETMHQQERGYQAANSSKIIDAWNVKSVISLGILSCYKIAPTTFVIIPVYLLPVF
jgi:hypothetical protein